MDSAQVVQRAVRSCLYVQDLGPGCFRLIICTRIYRLMATAIVSWDIACL
jgi:hypothetical protein